MDVAKAALQRAAAVDRCGAAGLVGVVDDAGARAGRVASGGAEQGAGAQAGVAERADLIGGERDRGVQASAGGQQLGLAAGDVQLHEFTVGDRLASAAGLLVGREREQCVEGVAGDAEADRGDASGEGSEEGLAVERGVDRRGGQQREAARVRDDELVDRDIVAAGAAQPAGVPGVVDLELVALEQQTAQLGAGGVAGVDEHAAHEPAGVLAAAAERPAAAHAIAGLLAGGPAERGEHAAGDHVRR
nr:hypothetical protein [Nannocystis sp.]